jgi:hypothetical protein
MSKSMSVVQVKVKPSSRASKLEKLADGSYLAYLKSPPVDGRANAELIALLAGHLGVPKSAISIKSGAASRIKRISVTQTR